MHQPLFPNQMPAIQPNPNALSQQRGVTSPRPRQIPVLAHLELPGPAERLWDQAVHQLSKSSVGWRYPAAPLAPALGTPELCLPGGSPRLGAGPCTLPSRRKGLTFLTSSNL